MKVYFKLLTTLNIVGTSQCTKGNINWESSGKHVAP